MTATYPRPVTVPHVKTGEHWPIHVKPTRAIGEYEVLSRTVARHWHLVRLTNTGDRCSCAGWNRAVSGARVAAFASCVHIKALRAQGFAEQVIAPEPVRTFAAATRGLY